jgi:rod shape-determining protein MreD
MIVTWKLAVRIALVIVGAVVLQVSFFSYIPLFGVVPDIVPVVVVALGLLGGGVVGAVCGFATGMLVDSVLLQTLGTSALLLLLAGYLAGRYREGAEISNSLIPPLLAGALSLLVATGFAAIELMLGVDTPVSLLVLREIFLKGVYAVFLAVPIFAVVRRVLRPGLVDDAPAHRVLTSSARRGRSRRVARMRRRPV